jgi:hypothetical protein
MITPEAGLPSGNRTVPVNDPPGLFGAGFGVGFDVGDGVGRVSGPIVGLVVGPGCGLGPDSTTKSSVVDVAICRLRVGDVDAFGRQGPVSEVQETR